MSSARLENNQIFGGICANGGTLFVGIDAQLETGPSELDVHSNHIDGDGTPVTCRSIGIRLSQVTPGPVPPTIGSGRYRNNIIQAGLCSTAYGIEETAAEADPRELRNNDFVPGATALYRDEGTTDLPDAASINARTDLAVAGNIDADPMQTGYPADLHLASGSACDGAGTPAGAPPFDMDGEPRSAAAPDIGPDEL